MAQALCFNQIIGSKAVQVTVTGCEPRAMLIDMSLSGLNTQPVNSHVCVWKRGGSK